MNKNIGSLLLLRVDLEAMIADIERGKKTLEIGCETGIILKQVSIIADEAWGMNLSSGMLVK